MCHRECWELRIINFYRQFTGKQCRIGGQAQLKNIKLIACNIDGVLLEDTFSPIFRNLVLKYGCEYTREFERSVFSRPLLEAGDYMMKTFHVSDGPYLYKTYFEERKKYLENHYCGMIEGVPEFLQFAATLNLRLVCYGGLAKEHIQDEFKEFLPYFEKYICTINFRPGIKEITKEYGLEYNQVLFIDDVNTVAEAAKANKASFIGIPSNFPWGFQRQDMISTGVKYILDSVKDINRGLLEKIDAEAAAGTLWLDE
jgi:phosphoglycolate phosphatase-like HAD superfamily hydrolase